MEKAYLRYKTSLLWLFLLLIGIAVAVPLPISAQYYQPEITPPPPSVIPAPPAIAPGDSVQLPLPVRPSVPQSYEDLVQSELAYDLSTPSNIVTSAEFDPATGCYVVHTRLGGIDIAQPFIITAQQYND